MKNLKTFLLKIGTLTILLVSTYFYFAYRVIENEESFNYAKFTHKANSLIIGLSRAHFGINPKIIEEEFKGEINLPVLNFAFNKSESPYGEVLLNSVKKKLDTNNLNNGLFILSVNPGSFLSKKNVNPNKIDDRLILNKITNLNSDPNFEYIRKGYSKPLYTGLLKLKSKKKYHKNGWIEHKTNLEKLKLNKKVINSRKAFLIKRQIVILKQEEFSNFRLQKFKETIEFLNNYGKVYLVRMPSDTDVKAKENKYFPNFNKDMEEVATHYNIPYFNYNSPKDSIYKTFDGTHLTGISANKFTKQLCEDIKNYQQQ